MSENEAETRTQHALLVIWGQFAQAFGLIQAVNNVALNQKRSIIVRIPNVLLHFGADPVTDNPANWFTFYNARQTIEAGIKEGKGTFAMRYLKVRSKPALYLQEQFGRFAANFVRFAAEWVAQQCCSVPSGWEDPAQPQVKQQVRVGAHTSAWVTWQEHGCLVRFTDHSVFAGRSLSVSKPVAIQLALPFAQKVQT